MATYNGTMQALSAISDKRLTGRLGGYILSLPTSQEH